MIEPADVAEAAKHAVLIDSSTLIYTSVTGLVSVIVIVALAVRGYTVITLAIAALTTAVKELKSWHLAATASARDEIDDLAESVERRAHRWRSWQTAIELRLGRIEHSSGIPSPIASDLTPIEDPHPPRRARARTTTGPQRPAPSES